MKRLLIPLVLLMMAGASSSVLAKDGVLPPGVDKKIVETNLLNGLAIPNVGLQRSCIFMLGKIESERAVIPLMAVLHDNPDVKVREAAAWALCRIGDARGTYVVKMAAVYDPSSKVQATCAWYYENFVQHGSFIFITPEYPLVASSD